MAETNNTQLDGTIAEKDSSIDVNEIMKKAGRAVDTTEQDGESSAGVPPKRVTPSPEFIGRAAEMSANDDIAKSDHTTVFKSDISAHGHGDIIALDDDVLGIVVDLEAESEEAIQSTKIPKIENLIDDSAPLYEKMSGEASSDSTDYGLLILQQGNTSKAAAEVFKVKNAYKDFSPTLTGVDLAGSDSALRFQEAKEALRSGKVRLPTVDEYDRQVAELKRKKKEEQRIMEQQNAGNTQQQNQAPQQSEPINIAEMQDRYEQQQRQQQTIQQRQFQDQEPVSSQHVRPEHVTSFKVPEGSAESFINSLGKDDREKVEASKVIKVEEERMVKVPVATKKITSLDEYKRISQNKAISEAVEVPLLNSGYVATVNGCGSLEMAAILPSVEDMDWEDYAKVYSFCFRRLVSTSIGVLSYRDFQVKTSPLDLPQLVYAVLRASQPDVSSITLTCGNSKCRKDYDIEYSLQDLPDWDDVGEEILKRIDEITSVRGILDEARKVHEASPVMTEKYVDVGDGKTVAIKIPNGPMAIERTNEEYIQKIADATSPLAAMFLINIKSIFLEITDEKGEEETYELVDMMAIASELQTFSDTQLEILRNELGNVNSYEGFTYSFKGLKGKDIVCPHCGLVNKKIPCNVQQLVFLKVSRAMN